MKEIYRPTLHSIDIPGDFLSLFYKDSIALILKSPKDKNKNGTTVQLTTKMNMKALTWAGLSLEAVTTFNATGSL